MHDVSCEDCRVLIVDDNRSFHDELREALRPRLAKVDADQTGDESGRCRFDVVSAYHGREAYRALCNAAGAGRRFDLAFVAIRMPTGWDRVATIEQLWKIDAQLQVVISGRLSDASWRSIAERLGHDANTILLRVPIDKLTALQLAAILTQKRRSSIETDLQPIDRQQSRATNHAELHQELHHELRVAISALTQASELARRVVPVKPIAADEMEPVIVREMIDELVGDRVLLSIGTSVASATIRADRLQIHAALKHLCSCASDAMPLGDTINIDAKIVDPTGRFSPTMQPGRRRPVPRHVAIRISDSGSSIPINVRDRLFAPFLAPQSIAGPAAPYCSTVYGIIKRHGGWIEIESSFAGGTTVVIHLPLIDALAAVPEATPAYESLDQWSRRHPAVPSTVPSMPRGRVTAPSSIFHFPR